MSENKLYSIAVTEISYGFVEVYANSSDEAYELAKKEYDNGNVIWNNSEVTIDNN